MNTRDNGFDYWIAAASTKECRAGANHVPDVSKMAGDFKTAVPASKRCTGNSKG
jgi:hypothetical protein